MLDMQNKSHAVMSQRVEENNSLDDFPTPPWATRALIEHVIGVKGLNILTCREPACGRGYMAEVLKEYFGKVKSSDIESYGYSKAIDFLADTSTSPVDWVITNPPFRLAEQFIQKGLKTSKVGVAVLVRTVFLEGKGRYLRLFSCKPPQVVAQFVERVPIVKGRVDPKAKSATGYAWLLWYKKSTEKTQVVWIPPCRKNLEKNTDYI